jgi:hypothetical protein
LIDYSFDAIKQRGLCESGEKAIIIQGSEEEDPD